MGNADLVQILLTHGADVDARDNKNLTPVYVARESGTVQELKELKKRLRYFLLLLFPLFYTFLSLKEIHAFFISNWFTRKYYWIGKNPKKKKVLVLAPKT